MIEHYHQHFLMAKNEEDDGLTFSFPMITLKYCFVQVKIVGGVNSHEGQ